MKTNSAILESTIYYYKPSKKYSSLDTIPLTYVLTVRCELSCPEGLNLFPDSSRIFSCIYSTGVFQPSPLPRCVPATGTARVPDMDSVNLDPDPNFLWQKLKKYSVENLNFALTTYVLSSYTSMKVIQGYPHHPRKTSNC